MTIEDGLVSLLNANAGVTALVAGRIYPALLPEDPQVPAITYRRISGVTAYNLDDSVLYEKVRIEFTSWGAAYGDCKAVQTALRAALDRFSGALPNGLAVQFVWRDGAEVDDFDRDRRLYNSSIDYRAVYA